MSYSNIRAFLGPERELLLKKYLKSFSCITISFIGIFNLAIILIRTYCHFKNNIKNSVINVDDKLIHISPLFNTENSQINFDNNLIYHANSICAG